MLKDKYSSIFSSKPEFQTHFQTNLLKLTPLPWRNSSMDPFAEGSQIQTDHGRCTILWQLPPSHSSRLFLVQDPSYHHFILKVIHGMEPATVFNEEEANRQLRGSGFLFVSDEWLEVGGTRAFLTPYCEDGDLLSLAQSQRLDRDTIANFVCHICQGLAFMHERGWVHRDIKPENILIVSGNPYTAQIADFGLAIRLDRSDHAIVGTRGFAAPEIFNGRYDEKVDMWSLGELTYRLLCGSPGAITEDIVSGLSSLRPRDTMRFSDEAMDFMAALLVRDPRRRPSALEALNHPFLARSATDNAFSNPSVMWG
jgi:serine/threonine protein kinase